jgi:hypothetical protein
MERLEKISSIVGKDRLVVDVRSGITQLCIRFTTAENCLAVAGVETDG